MNKSTIKQLLGEIPLTAELYWQIRQKGSSTTVRMNLDRLRKSLPGWVQDSAASPHHIKSGKRVLIFSMIHYWIEHTTLLSLTLAGLGHDVTLAYLPYAQWKKPINRFDLRRQNAYIGNVLRPATSLIDVISLFNPLPNGQPLPSTLIQNLKGRAYQDAQYSMLVEEVDTDGELYHLRLARNTEAACASLAWMKTNRPDVVITPNGSILEFGVIYEVAQYLNIPVITYEFGEQNHRIWIAQNDDVMRQKTDDLWAARGDVDLTEAEWERIRKMFAFRQGARQWATFVRQWQGTPSQGVARVRANLGLDDRPIVFLPTNVLGDSLTLGREIFSGMTDWLRKTIRYFIERPHFKLVIRVHPGEQISWGPSVCDILSESFPKFPENIHLLPADANVNSYDLLEAADLGLVYTTTMGMEMAMSGKPVIVAGETHYRGKGFTLDPESWDAYFETLEQALQAPTKFYPSKVQVERAWQYAYRFFFEYPKPFPWHLLHYWDELAKWPISRVLSDQGQAKFGDTFRYLVSEPINWSKSSNWSQLSDLSIDPLDQSNE